MAICRGAGSRSSACGSLMALLSLLVRLPVASPLVGGLDGRQGVGPARARPPAAAGAAAAGLLGWGHARRGGARNADALPAPLCCRLRGGAVYNASWEPSYRQGSPTVWAAARVGDLDALRGALEAHAPDAADDEGRTALHWAAIAGRPELVSELLQRGANPLARDDYGWAPLHSAASSGNAPVLSMILSAAQNASAGADRAAADIITADEREATPLLLACGKNDSSAVRLLLSASTATVSTRDKEGLTPLIRAGMQGNVDILDQLLASGASINEQDALGNSSLHYMCNGLTKNQVPQAVTLLERGADPFLTNTAGDTPVDYLDFDVAKVLARENMAMRRRKGAAARSDEEQLALELKIMHESVESLAERREGPENVRVRAHAHSACTCAHSSVGAAAVGIPFAVAVDCSKHQYTTYSCTESDM